MHKLVILTSACLVALGGVAAAQSLPQPNRVQGTPGSIFPYATPQEIKIINGVPCRTVLTAGAGRRVPVACAGRIAAGAGGPLTTGSVRTYAPRRAQ